MVTFPVAVLTEGAAVASDVTAAARLAGDPTAVPTILQKNDKTKDYRSIVFKPLQDKIHL